MLDNLRQNFVNYRTLIYVLLLSPNFVTFYFYRGFILKDLLSNSNIRPDLIFIGKLIYAIMVFLFAMLEQYAAKRISKDKLLRYYIFYSVIINSLILFLQTGPIIILLCSLSGGAYGLGFPLVISIIRENTPVEKMGRVSGSVFFFNTLIYMILVFITGSNFYTTNQYIKMIIVIQLFSLTSMFLIKNLNFIPVFRTTTFSEALFSNSFILYFIPWILYNFANAIGSIITYSVNQTYSDIYNMLSGLVQLLGSSILLIIGGILVDRYGRKLTLLIGFIALGSSFALYNFLTIPTIYVVTSLLSGMAWGSIIVSFLFVILGDYSTPGKGDIFYSLGVSITMIFDVFSTIAKGYSLTEFQTGIISPIISFALFFSVIPLLYAPETLPYEKIADRKVNDYLNKVLKILDSTSE